MDRALARAESASTGSGSDVPLPEDLVTCPITFEPYQVANDEDGDDFVPIDPPCHHTLSKIALKDILARAQGNPEKRLCPTCQEVLPSDAITDYKPNRFALGVLEAMEAARLRAEQIRAKDLEKALIAEDLDPNAVPGEGGDAPQPAAPAMAAAAYCPAPAQPEALPEGWPQICAEFDVQELGGQLQRFQAHQDVVARHRNGLVSSGILSLNGRDTRVAVKLVLPTDTAGNADVGAAARREAAALAHATRHVPGAVLQLKGFLHAGSFLIAQEVPGSSLIKHVEKMMNDQGGLKASTWLELMLQLIDCLRQLHACGVIHCDVSPASVCRSATGTLKLTDFSSARVGTPPEDGSTLLTAPVATFPSKRVAYLAPEQLIQVAALTKQHVAARGGAADAPCMPTGTVTDRTDIWAFAVLALHLWTGTPPTRGITPDYAASTLPDLLRDLFMGCLSGSPAQRPSASEVYDSLCMVTELRESIPQFAEETEICVGVPPHAAPPQRASMASTSRTSRSAAITASPGAPASQGVAVAAAAPAPAAAVAAPPSVSATQVAAAPATAAEEPTQKLSPTEQALLDLKRAQEEEARTRTEDAVKKPGRLGRIRQMLKASS